MTARQPACCQVYCLLRGAGATPIRSFARWPLQTSGAAIQLGEVDRGADVACELFSAWFAWRIGAASLTGYGLIFVYVRHLLGNMQFAIGVQEGGETGYSWSRIVDHYMGVVHKLRYAFVAIF